MHAYLDTSTHNINITYSHTMHVEIRTSQGGGGGGDSYIAICATERSVNPAWHCLGIYKSVLYIWYSLGLAPKYIFGHRVTFIWEFPPPQPHPLGRTYIRTQTITNKLRRALVCAYFKR